jgi:plasmid stability protein
VPKPPGDQKTKDFLLRDLPQETADKLKVAASLHRTPMKDYIRRLLEAHLEQLERRGVTLTLPKGKRSDARRRPGASGPLVTRRRSRPSASGNVSGERFYGR